MLTITVIYGLKLDNLYFQQVLDELPSDQHDLSYSSWIFYSLPLVIAIIIFTFIWLQLIYLRTCSRGEEEDNGHLKTFMKEKYSELGSMTFKEYMVLFYFLLLVVIWFFAEPNFIEGWSDSFKLPDGDEAVSEATPAILILILIMLTPANPNFGPCKQKRQKSLVDKTEFSSTIMDWKTLSKVYIFNLFMQIFK